MCRVRVGVPEALTWKLKVQLPLNLGALSSTSIAHPSKGMDVPINTCLVLPGHLPRREMISHASFATATTGMTIGEEISPLFVHAHAGHWHVFTSYLKLVQPLHGGRNACGYATTTSICKG